jgi:Holliday junction resolvase RusA-like endonuclease
MVEDLDNLMRETIDKEHHGTFYLRDHVEVTVEMKYKPEDK